MVDLIPREWKRQTLRNRQKVKLRGQEKASERKGGLSWAEGCARFGWTQKGISGGERAWGEGLEPQESPQIQLKSKCYAS